VPGPGPGRRGRGPTAPAGLTTLIPWSRRRFRPQADVAPSGPQYRGRVVSDDVRRMIALVAVAVAVVSALVDPSTPGELLLMAIPPAALVAWTLLLLPL